MDGELQKQSAMAMPRRPSDETAKAIRLIRSYCCDGMSRHHGTPLAIFNTSSRCLYHGPLFPAAIPADAGKIDIYRTHYFAKPNPECCDSDKQRDPF
jgi:hypothetical protein